MGTEETTFSFGKNTFSIKYTHQDIADNNRIKYPWDKSILGG